MAREPVHGRVPRAHVATNTQERREHIGGRGQRAQRAAVDRVRREPRGQHAHAVVLRAGGGARGSGRAGGRRARKRRRAHADLRGGAHAGAAARRGALRDLAGPGDQRQRAAGRPRGAGPERRSAVDAGGARRVVCGGGAWRGDDAACRPAAGLFGRRRVSRRHSGGGGDGVRARACCAPARRREFGGWELRQRPAGLSMGGRRSLGGDAPLHGPRRLANSAKPAVAGGPRGAERFERAHRCGGQRAHDAEGAFPARPSVAARQHLGRGGERLGMPHVSVLAWRRERRLHHGRDAGAVRAPCSHRSCRAPERGRRARARVKETGARRRHDEACMYSISEWRHAKPWRRCAPSTRHARHARARGRHRPRMLYIYAAVLLL
mmetsp:Transcript_5657/g.22334  ORF Transcript_5657/g.22334 Transcript_5657/m.22334 type:complete len:379 (-) Transcript_5657:1257-2393(-)